jgi:hypothetical protein
MDLLARKKNNKNEIDNSSNNLKDKDIIVKHKNVVESEEKKRKASSKKTIKEEKESISIVEKIKKIIKAKKDAWEAPKIIKTNLIKGEITSYFDWKRNSFILLKRLAVTSIFIGGVFLLLLIWEMDINKRGVDIKDEVERLHGDATGKEEKIKEIDLFHKKVTVAEILLGKHIYWTNFFSFLENDILEDVYITSSFDGNTSGAYEFSAKAKDYKTLAAQLVLLENSDAVISVDIAGGNTSGVSTDQSGMDQSSVDFGFSVVLKNDIFFK